MKGKVLGFDGASGAILGEDGGRYSFGAANWKGQDKPSAGGEIDFVPKDDIATEIYPAPDSAPTTPRNGKTAQSPGSNTQSEPSADWSEFIRTRPQVLFFGLAILSFLVLNFVSFTDEGVSAFGLSSALGDKADLISRGSSSRMQDSALLFSGASTLALAMWAIPLVAGYGILRERSDRRSRKLEMITAGLCLLLSLIVFIGVLGAFASIGWSSQFGEDVSLGLGGYILLACGIGLILTGLNAMKTIPGWPSKSR